MFRPRVGRSREGAHGAIDPGLGRETRASLDLPVGRLLEPVVFLAIIILQLGKVAGIKLLLGVDPKESYKDQVAKVTLR